MIKKKLNFKDKIIWDKNYPDGMKRKLLDNKNMKEMGFNPKVSFQEGLKKLLGNLEKITNFLFPINSFKIEHFFEFC